MPKMKTNRAAAKRFRVTASGKVKHKKAYARHHAWADARCAAPRQAVRRGRGQARRSIAGAALDVYDTEPLPIDHPFRTLDNVLATPHIGYVTKGTYRVFYGDTVKAIADWLQRC